MLDRLGSYRFPFGLESNLKLIFDFPILSIYPAEKENSRFYCWALHFISKWVGSLAVVLSNSA